MSAARILIAGIGNVFLGDDGFGVEVVRRLGEGVLPTGVRAIDFGVRGFDLACALVDGYDAAILVDVAQRGGEPGTLYVIDPDSELTRDLRADVDGHALEPTKVFALARALGGTLPAVRFVACEPERVPDPDGDVDVGLSRSVSAAVEPAMKLAISLAEQLRQGAADA